MRKIELLIGLEDSYGRSVARGVIRFVKTRADWKLYGYGREKSRLFSTLAELEGARPDGIIARIMSREQARALASLRIPVIDVAGAYPGAGFYEVNNDDTRTGMLAGGYFRGLGFRSFAFCGVPEAMWSLKRKLGYLEATDHRRGTLPCFERPIEWWREGEDAEGDLEAFLRSLDPATALLACNDAVGLKSAELCSRLKIAVPDQVAILGVDDEDLLCELSGPTLSSVHLDCETIGFRAAELLHGVLETAHEHPGGGAAGQHGHPVLIPPIDIVERESSRIHVTDDPLVSHAVSWIRANAHRRIDVGDLLAAVPASRRSLEKRFRATLGRTLHEEILATRVAGAKRLLATADDPLDVVSGASGFGSLQRFHLTFRRLTGMSPGEWRKLNR